LYFTVPGNVSRFALQISGAGTAETVKATIRDATNRVVATQDDIASPHLFVLEREDNVPPEIWSIRLEKATTGVLEDVAIRALGIPPLFATSPDRRFTSAEAETGVSQDSCLTP
jgi:hypothetical protein